MSQNLQRYKIGKKIGEGAMGAVYRAYDTQTKRDVAIKMLASGTLHGRRLARFKQEARTIAPLEHPFVVPLYDYSLPEGDEQPPFLVMRYMKGGSLADKIGQGRLPIEEVSQILRRIASALDAAHNRGLIHRDLKPGNILLDQDGYAYLADFGIVKDTKAEESLTIGQQLGTSLYMSPEQILGEKLDHRSDIYALGVVAFEMLTGRPPYIGDMHTIFQGHLHEEIPRLYAFTTGLPDELDNVLRKAMAKKPQDRYVKASQMAKAFEAALNSPPAYRQYQSFLAETPEAFEFKPLADEEEARSDTKPSPSVADTAASADASRQWQLLAAGLAIVLLIVVALFVGNRLGQTNQVASDAVTAVSPNAQLVSTNTPRPATPIPNVILVLRQDESAIWQNDDRPEKLPEDGRIPFRNPVTFRSGREPIELLLPNFTRIILDKNSTVRVATAVADGETTLELLQGRILIKSDQPVRIHHADKYETYLLTGMIGVEVNQDATHWEVDCLIGTCLLEQVAANEPLAFNSGQSAQLAEDAEFIIVDTQLSRLEIYNLLDVSINLPTATATETATATNSPPPTATPTNTATAAPLPTPTPIPTLLVESFEIYDDNSLIDAFWINPDAGNIGSFRIVGTPYAVEGKQALAFDFTIFSPVEDHYFIGFEHDFPAQDWSGYSQLCLWVEHVGSGSELVIQIRDSNEELLKASPTPLDIIDTGDYCISLNEEATAINFLQISNYGIYVEGSPAGDGVLYIDNIRLMKE